MGRGPGLGGGLRPCKRARPKTEKTRVRRDLVSGDRMCLADVLASGCRCWAKWIWQQMIFPGIGLWRNDVAAGLQTGCFSISGRSSSPATRQWWGEGSGGGSNCMTHTPSARRTPAPRGAVERRRQRATVQAGLGRAWGPSTAWATRVSLS